MALSGGEMSFPVGCFIAQSRFYILEIVGYSKAVFAIDCNMPAADFFSQLNRDQ